MSQTERSPVSYGRQHGLRDSEIEIGEQVQRGDLLCPCCEAGLQVMPIFVAEGLYQGVMLFCPNQSGCGFIEF